VGLRCYSLIPALALALLFSWPATAEQPAGKPPSPAFVVHTTAGADATGPLRRLLPDWTVAIGAGNGVVVPGAPVTVRRAGVPLPPHPLAAQIVFASGDRVPVDLNSPLRLADDRLHFRPRPPLATAKEWQPPLNRVALIWLRAPRGAEDADLELRRLLARQPPRDRVLLTNGDSLEGLVTALDSRTVVRVESAGGQAQEVPFAGVAAVVFRAAWLEPGLPKTAYAQVVASDGCRLSLADARLDAAATTLHGNTLFGADVQLPVADLVALEVRQGKAVYLSDLRPASYEHTPYLGAAWPYVKDGSVTGRQLRLATGTHDKGLGLHAHSRITYKLDGKYSFFEALVGLDAKTAPAGRARACVLLDGKPAPAWEREVTGRTAAVPVRLDVRKAKTLTLVVDFGKVGDVQTHVNWADARLLP
jgi:hypothetical protein